VALGNVEWAKSRIRSRLLTIFGKLHMRGRARCGGDHSSIENSAIKSTTPLTEALLKPRLRQRDGSTSNPNRSFVATYLRAVDDRGRQEGNHQGKQNNTCIESVRRRDELLTQAFNSRFTTSHDICIVFASESC
jgi:hypothetical protein